MEFGPNKYTKGTGAETCSMKWDEVRIKTHWQFYKLYVEGPELEETINFWEKNWPSPQASLKGVNVITKVVSQGSGHLSYSR